MTKTTTRKSSRSRSRNSASIPVVITTGCPSGIGPEVALAAARHPKSGAVVLVGDRENLAAAAQALRLDPAWARSLPAFDPTARDVLARPRVSLFEPFAPLAARDRKFGRPTARAGAAQLAFIEAGYRLAKERGLALVTGPVSKQRIATSGVRGAERFHGHTEWLEELDGAPYTVMCFSSPQLVTSLVTTHLPLSRVPRVLGPEKVSRATVELVDLLLREGRRRPKIAVCAFNPHAGEGEMFGSEERLAILPGIQRARGVVGKRASITGPLGAETAFRVAVGGAFDGVVGIYHDQVTIPMKLVDFGGSVNVTQGLSIVRTSVDHGTAYDIAGKGVADALAMQAAIAEARVLSGSARRLVRGEH